MTGYLIAVLQCFLIVALAPLFSGISRWLRAKMHTRQGAPILQDYYDLAKLFKRRDICTESSTYVSKLMPILFLGTLLVIICGLPIFTQLSPVPVFGDMITVVYLLAIPRFFFALAGIDRSNAYAGAGSIRELLIGVLVEPSIMLSLVVVAIATGTTAIGGMSMTVSEFAVQSPVAFMIAGIAFLFACYIELGKLPYDLAEAEQELQEGPLAEFSGPSFALSKLALSVKQLVMIALFLAIFCPFGSASPDAGALGIIVGIIVFLLKVLVAVVAAAIVENSVSRVRYKLLGRQTWAILGIAVIAFVFSVVGM